MLSCIKRSAVCTKDCVFIWNFLLLAKPHTFLPLICKYTLPRCKTVIFFLTFSFTFRTEILNDFALYSLNKNVLLAPPFSYFFSSQTSSWWLSHTVHGSLFLNLSPLKDENEGRTESISDRYIIV